MIQISTFTFNSFGVNTYLLYDETNECLIIDPACQYTQEEQELSDFIEANRLKPVRMINTHAHIDHILGNTFVCEKYNLKPEAHIAGLKFYEIAPSSGSVFGISVGKVIMPVDFLKEGDIVKIGNFSLKVLYTPGHADGSICLVNDEDSFVITGDVLFQESIGRTDLPTGNLDKLLESIRLKLFTLPDQYIVYPGHGPTTTIGFEKRNNPFIS
jgi:glyoxylase-like metal-dependent hydrolase (beta-lactamase superfamily II)